MNTELYQLNYRKLGNAVAVSVTSKRGSYTANSAEKVIPPVLEFDKESNFRLIDVKDVLGSLPFHPYKAVTADFNRARLADVEIHTLMKGLESFPSIPSVLTGTTKVNHPIAEYLYGSQIYLKPTPDLQAELDKLDFLAKSQQFPVILEKLMNKWNAKSKYQIDLFSVPKKDVGTFGYLTRDGYSEPSKLFSFGYHRAIPMDRIGRELGSFKQAEQYLNPAPAPNGQIVPEWLKPFVTWVRVAVVGLDSSMLDGADLYPSIKSKIACNLRREVVVADVSTIPIAERNLKLIPFRSGIDVVHIDYQTVDETYTQPGTMRFVLPGGIKAAGEINSDLQARDESGNTIDMLMDFETFSKKGAVATLAMLSGQTEISEPTLEQCKMIWANMPLSKVTVNETTYTGWIGYLPVIRPGQRYTELSKASSISVDLIAKAIMGKKYVVNAKLEEKYKQLSRFRSDIQSEMSHISQSKHE